MNFELPKRFTKDWFSRGPYVGSNADKVLEAIAAAKTFSLVPLSSLQDLLETNVEGESVMIIHRVFRNPTLLAMLPKEALTFRNLLRLYSNRERDALSYATEHGLLHLIPFNKLPWRDFLPGLPRLRALLQQVNRLPGASVSDEEVLGRFIARLERMRKLGKRENIRVS